MSKNKTLDPVTFLKFRIETMPEPPPRNYLTWYVVFDALYRDYLLSAKKQEMGFCDKMQFWKWLKSEFPEIRIDTHKEMGMVFKGGKPVVDADGEHIYEERIEKRIANVRYHPNGVGAGEKFG